MITIAQVEQVLRSLPPQEGERAGNFAQHELHTRIDDALTVVMDWLTIVKDPTADTNGLLQCYPRAPKNPSNEEERFSVENTEQYIREKNLNHLAYEILNNLLPWIRKKDGLSLEFQHELRLGRTEFDSSTETQFLNLNSFINQTIFSNPIVTNHPQAFEFFRVLSYVESGIESFEELELILNQISSDQIISMIDSIGPDYFASELTLCGAPPNPARATIVNRIINNAATRSGKTRLEVATHLSNKCSMSYDLARAQFDIIKESITAEQSLNLRETLSSVGDAFSETYLFWTTLDSRQRINSVYPCDALRNINFLLLSQPGSERQDWLRECQLTAHQMIGHANPKWRALGITIFILGAVVAALGLASIISGGAIPIVLGIGTSVVGIGIFAHNRQKGPSMATQKLHDEIKNRPDSHFVSTFTS